MVRVILDIGRKVILRREFKEYFSKYYKLLLIITLVSFLNKRLLLVGFLYFNFNVLINSKTIKLVN